MTGCRHSHFSGSAGVFEHVGGDLLQNYVAEMEILTKDQKTFPNCFVAQLNPSSRQEKKKAFSFFLFLPLLVLQRDRTTQKMVKLGYKGVM